MSTGCKNRILWRVLSLTLLGSAIVGNIALAADKVVAADTEEKAPAKQSSVDAGPLIENPDFQELKDGIPTGWRAINADPVKADGAENALSLSLQDNGKAGIFVQLSTTIAEQLQPGDTLHFDMFVQSEFEKSMELYIAFEYDYGDKRAIGKKVWKKVCPGGGEWNKVRVVCKTDQSMVVDGARVSRVLLGIRSLPDGLQQPVNIHSPFAEIISSAVAKESDPPATAEKTETNPEETEPVMAEEKGTEETAPPVETEKPVVETEPPAVVVPEPAPDPAPAPAPAAERKKTIAPDFSQLIENPKFQDMEKGAPTGWRAINVEVAQADSADHALMLTLLDLEKAGLFVQISSVIADQLQPGDWLQFDMFVQSDVASSVELYVAFQYDYGDKHGFGKQVWQTLCPGGGKWNKVSVAANIDESLFIKDARLSHVVVGIRSLPTGLRKPVKIHSPQVSVTNFGL